MAFRFLHCSDIHLLSLRGTAVTEFFNKRMTGALNLALARRRKHDDALFVAMMRAARELALDHVVITGDLTNLALDAEFAFVEEQLAAAQLPIFVIPGNHDAYVADVVDKRRFAGVLQHYAHLEGPDEDYPVVVRHQQCALIGVSSAIATQWFCAAGEVGSAQLERLAHCLESLAGEQSNGQPLARVVLIHHPITPNFDHLRRGLRDAPALREVLAKHGAELVLHGHEHRTFTAEVPGPNRPIPVHGIASGTSLSTVPDRRAAFAVYTVDGDRITRDLHVWRDEAFVRE